MTKADGVAVLRLPPQLPPWPLGERTLYAVAEWDDAIASSWRETWEPPLVALSKTPVFLDLTETGRRHRLAIDAAELPLRPSDPAARARSFIESVAAITYGDCVIGPLGRTLARLPGAVAEHFLQAAVVLATGVESRAWTARLTLPADRLVVALSSDDPFAFAHEVVHAFYDFDRERPPPVGMTALAVARARFHASERAEHERSVDDQALLLRIADADRRADLLARVWTSRA